MNPIGAAWALDGPLDVVTNTALTRTARADPTGFLRDGRVWRASRHPSGPATLSFWTTGSVLRAEAWGPGAEEALVAVPALTGLTDDPSGFEPSGHWLVHDVARARPGVRLSATGSIFDAAVRAILGQKVTGLQAKRSFQALARRCDDRAPLPVVSRRPLFLPPPPDETLRALAGHGATTLGIDATRAAVLREVANVADHVDALTRGSAQDARAALERIPGLGPWTSNEITVVAMADADAVSVGDYHLKNIVSFALADEPRGTDERMVELLEVFRPHRARAVRLIEVSGVRPPRYGPRMDVPAHVPVPRP
ncbi:MAG: DNA-3-methyladenine glycosylase 2 family protein [Actinobacteria bacterium]|nr:DNA-3-methyladenine glycosylase 2 family protein [Actinomycetota bacterium]